MVFLRPSFALPLCALLLAAGCSGKGKQPGLQTYNTRTMRYEAS
jgi:hypothetical protein